ncbi:MAG: radical SAM protein, partial [Bacteroidota bacterium]
KLLLDLFVETAEPYTGEKDQQIVVEKGWAQQVEDTMTLKEIERRYAQNPIENVKRISFEYTTVCNLACLHCRNGNLKPVTEKNTDRLKDIVDQALPLGIRRFDFIGGEVTLYARGWLDLVGHIRKHEDTIAAVITSGWFFGRKDFKAAGKFYADDRAYLADLAEAGLTHVIFSLDGPADIHDACRQVPGLYAQIICGIDKVFEAGLEPRVSVVLGEQLGRDAMAEWLADLAARIYMLLPVRNKEENHRRAHLLFKDKTNYMSNFIDIGNGVELRQKKHHIDNFRDQDIRCKNFYRPYPNLRIKANGEISLCPLVDGGDGYGNIHEAGGGDFIHLLNTMQDRFVFRLHAEKKIGAYRRYLDTDIFGTHFDHVCSLRTVLTMLARELHEKGIDPEEDFDGLHAANIAVARRAGYMAAEGKTALGTREPF